MKAQEDFQLAVQLRGRGEYNKALAMLLPLERELGRSASYFAILADTHWEVGQNEKAIKAFRRAARIAPDSETISLGLFHCLWECGDADGAFREMRRLLSIADSEEYKRLLAEINAP